MKLQKMIAALSAAAIAAACTAIPVSAIDSTSEAPFTAFLCMSAAGTWYELDQTADCMTAATIEEDGSYVVSITVPEGGGSENVDLLLLSTNINGYAFTPEGGDILTDTSVSIVIDSIFIEHTDGSVTDIPYNGPSAGAFATENNGTDYRLNVLNTWGNNVADIDNTLPAPLGDGDTISMEFTITGLEESPFAVAKGDVDKNGSVDAQDAYATLVESSKIAIGGSGEFTEEQIALGDINGNGSIDQMDAFWILMYNSYVSLGQTITWEELLG